MKARFLVIGLIALLPATTTLAKKPPEQLGPPSKAITEEIVDAIAEEMNRAMTRLEIPGAPKPYSISCACQTMPPSEPCDDSVPP